VTENPKRLRSWQLEAAQLRAAQDEVEAAAINSNFAPRRG
jgi:ABC-type metal ion transport system substrate-binding protein